MNHSLLRKIQSLINLFLIFQKHNSVLEALEALVMKDKLEGVTCSKTKQQVEAWQQVTVEELPLVLVLHLKCFNYKLDVCSKIIKALEFPIELKIDSSKLFRFLSLILIIHSSSLINLYYGC